MADGDVFSDIRLTMLENLRASGHPVDDSQIQDASAALLTMDPACWSWPAPISCSFADEETANRFLTFWSAGCAICGISGYLVLDHDHATGFIRGRICHACNVREGRAGPEDVTIVKYRERNPATILGIKARYVSLATGEEDQGRPQATSEEQRATHLRHQSAVAKLAARLPSPDSLTKP